MEVGADRTGGRSGTILFQLHLHSALILSPNDPTTLKTSRSATLPALYQSLLRYTSSFKDLNKIVFGTAPLHLAIMGTLSGHPSHQHIDLYGCSDATLGLSCLNKILVLLRVTLFDTALDHPLHDSIAVDDNALLDPAGTDGPLALDVDGTSRGLSVNGGIDTLGLVDEGQFECRLSDRPFVGHFVDTGFADGRLAARNFLVVDKLGTGNFDVDIVIMKGCNHSLFFDTCRERGGDGGFRRHLDVFSKVKLC